MRRGCDGNQASSPQWISPTRLLEMLPDRFGALEAVENSSIKHRASLASAKLVNGPGSPAADGRATRRKRRTASRCSSPFFRVFACMAVIATAPPGRGPGGAPASRLAAGAARMDTAALRVTPGRRRAPGATRLDAAALRHSAGRDLGAAVAARLHAAALRVLPGGELVLLAVYGSQPGVQPRGLEGVHLQRVQIQPQLVHDLAPGNRTKRTPPVPNRRRGMPGTISTGPLRIPTPPGRIVEAAGRWPFKPLRNKKIHDQGQGWPGSLLQQRVAVLPRHVPRCPGSLATSPASSRTETLRDATASTPPHASTAFLLPLRRHTPRGRSAGPCRRVARGSIPTNAPRVIHSTPGPSPSRPAHGPGERVHRRPRVASGPRTG